MNNSIKSLIFNAIQVSSLLVVLLTGKITPNNFVVLGLYFTLVITLALGVWEMRRNKFIVKMENNKNYLWNILTTLKTIRKLRDD